MKTEQEVFEVIKKAPFTVIVVFICFFSIWSVIGLAGFHTYLTTSDQTTNEDVSIIKIIINEEHFHGSSSTAQGILLLQRRSAHPESLLAWQHLPELLSHPVRTHDALTDRQVSSQLTLRS